MKEEIYVHAENIWAFLSPDYSVRKSDFILVLGGSDLRVAEYASTFWSETLADYMVVSGGFGKVTRALWKVSEARKFSQIMIAGGVPEHKIVLEEKATHTGENVVLTKRLLSDLGLPRKTGILLTKPYMKRRAYNTASKQWSEVNWSVTSEAIAFRDYLQRQEDPLRFISLMAGDLQRMEVYAEKGFQIRDEIPGHVWNSYSYLVKSGFDKYLVKTH